MSTTVNKDSEPVSKVYLIVGLSLDKRKMFEWYSKMAKDKDIHKIVGLVSQVKVLIKLSFVFQFVLPSLGCIVSFIFGLVSLYTCNWNTINMLTVIAIVGLLISALFLLFDYLGWRKRLSRRVYTHSEPSKNGLKDFRKKYKSNVDLWHIFLDNISDAQTILPFKAKGHEVALYYTGEPYYTIRLIDSIYLDFNPPAGCSKATKKIYEKLYKNSKIILDDTMNTLVYNYITQYDNIVQKKNCDQNTYSKFSDYVFGINFLSSFFYNLNNLSNKKSEHSISNFKKFDFYIKNVNDGKRELKEIVELSLDHAKFKWIDENKCNWRDNDHVSIGISATFNDEKNVRCGKNVLRIPVKRPIAVPNGNSSGYLPAVLEDELKKDEKTKGVKSTVFFVGGAEHNLALLCALNEYQRTFISNDGTFGVGILENKFDYFRDEPFGGGHPLLLSAEKFVQAFYMTGRNTQEPTRFAQNYAGELYKFSITGERKLYVFFGYSAPMTKIISAALAENMEYYLSQIDDGKKDIKRNVLLLYNRFKNKSSNIFDWEEIKTWDKYDLVNNPGNCPKNGNPLIVINSPDTDDLYAKIKESAYGHNFIHEHNAGTLENRKEIHSK